MHTSSKQSLIVAIALVGYVTGFSTGVKAEPDPQPLSISQTPLFELVDPPPLNMLVMGRDHTLYYEAYNDASDLNGDGVLNVGYEPDKVDYYGYFDSWLCYSYVGGEFSPSGSTETKKCTTGWSGDFLNYVTTSRIDALRKVLYGGKRVEDTTTKTVLERAYIPQDAHSWGKEYESIERDGYDIREYTPLDLPAPGTRHLFANTTLLKSGNMEPLMRVLNDSRYRIWEWVAIERPVAGSRCLHGGSGPNCEYAATTETANNPDNTAEFNVLEQRWARSAQLCGTGNLSGGNIDSAVSATNNNPWANAVPDCSHDQYLTRIQGEIYLTAGTWEFATNGDDGVDFTVDGQVVSWWYGGGGTESGSPSEIAEAIRTEATAEVGSITVDSSGWYPFTFRHHATGGNDSFQLLYRPLPGAWEVVPASELRTTESLPLQVTTWSTTRDLPASEMDDYIVRVEVCNSSYLEPNCKEYPGSGTGATYKPTGLLHEYGEEDRMLFGLITGSFTHPENTRGGVLRKNVESFKDEINLETGQFQDVSGIVSTLDSFRIVDFNASQNYQYNGGWLTNAPLVDSNSQFPDWGNPIAEMMYESIRYFAGKTGATSEFLPVTMPTTGEDTNETVTLRHSNGASTMDLPVAAWQDPFDRGDTSALYCSAAAQLVISDANPNYDTQYLPGSAFSSFSGDLADLDVSAEASTIWSLQYGGSGTHFIGQTQTENDSAPTPKTISSFNIRGLSPSEPTKQGGYYSASVARWAFNNDLRQSDDMPGKQHVHTFSVALASPLPSIAIPVGGNIVTVVPYAMSTGQGGTDWTGRDFMPTNTIVDFFVEEFANTDPGGSDLDLSINNGLPLIRFRINYEDVEQGADHDMDAITLYELRANADDTLTISLASEYQAGGITHNIGYVLSGTSEDGVYLEVRDGPGEANAYEAPQATPPGIAAGGCAIGSPPAVCDQPLPLFASRTFTPSGDSAATVLRNPLWYAARFGSEQPEEISAEDDPYNYFLVTNASTLAEQLEKAFQRILELGATSGLVASSTRLDLGALVYQAEFDSRDWSGDLAALNPQTQNEIARASEKLAVTTPGSRNILTFDPTSATPEGKEFDTFLPAEVKSRLATSLPAGGDVDDLIDYIRGVRDLEQSEGGDWRDRTTLLGDIVSSQPRLSGRQNFGWAPLNADYLEYLDDEDNGKAGRTPIVLVGSNSGMLHGFIAEDGSDLLKEAFAYVPSTVHANLGELADPDYNHRYFVDGTAVIGDARIGTGTGVNAWRTVTVGTLGAGGRGVFALDITDPLNPTVLWEIMGENEAGLGYSFSRPAITKLPGDDGEWVAIFGNGYNSETLQATLYVVNLKDGTILQRIPMGDAGANGLSSVAALRDPTTRQYTNRVYAGDLLGNMWRIDFADNGTGSVAFSGAPLFKDPNSRPITAAPDASLHPVEGYMVYFGTGKLIETSDRTELSTERLYMIRDLNVPVTSDATLIANSLAEGTEAGSRVVQSGTGDGVNGWYIDLKLPSADPGGERLLSEPQVLFGRTIFTTYQPSEDPCASGGTTRVYLVRALTGTGTGDSVGEGAPIAPPIVIREPSPPTGDGPGTPGLPPSLCDPSTDPSCDPDDDSSDPPPAATGSSEDWCREYGMLVPPDSTFVRLGNLCEGRATWRQVR
jgi:type IV pilus assembly protein PilY1